MAPFSLEMAVMAAVAVTVEAVRRLAVKQQAPPHARCCPRPRGWVVEGATCGRISSTATAGPRPWQGRTCPRLESRKRGWGPEKRRGLFKYGCEPRALWPQWGRIDTTWSDAAAAPAGAAWRTGGGGARGMGRNHWWRSRLAYVG